MKEVKGYDTLFTKFLGKRKRAVKMLKLLSFICSISIFGMMNASLCGAYSIWKISRAFTAIFAGGITLEMGYVLFLENKYTKSLQHKIRETGEEIDLKQLYDIPVIETKKHEVKLGNQHIQEETNYMKTITSTNELVYLKEVRKRITCLLVKGVEIEEKQLFLMEDEDVKEYKEQQAKEFKKTK